MKKSRSISLILITAALASCSQKSNNKDWEYGDKHVYMRSDTTAGYGSAYHTRHWYYAFRPYGSYGYYSGYTRAGYYSGALSESSNVGSNGFKSSVVRGGFGGSISVSS